MESNSILDIEDVDNRYKEVLDGIGEVELIEFNEVAIIHKLSHQHLHTKFWILNTGIQIPNQISFEKIKEFPVPVLIADFIKAFKF